MVVEDSKRAEDKSKGLFVRGLNQFQKINYKGKGEYKNEEKYPKSSQ